MNVGVTDANSFAFSETVNATPVSRLSKESVDINNPLKEVKYDGPVVIESFTSQIKEIASAVCIWREIAPSQDAIAEQGLKFLTALLV